MDMNPSTIEFSSQKIAGPVVSTGYGTNNGYGMDCGKAGNAGMMSDKSMIETGFTQQVPSAGVDAGKSGSGKEKSSMATTEVNAYGTDAGK